MKFNKTILLFVVGLTIFGLTFSVISEHFHYHQSSNTCCEISSCNNFSSSDENLNKSENSNYQEECSLCKAINYLSNLFLKTNFNILETISNKSIIVFEISCKKISNFHRIDNKSPPVLIN